MPSKLKPNQMKKLIFALVALLLALDVTAATVHKFATINARYCAAGDTGAKQWKNRRTSFGNVINGYDFDVMGFQEVSGSAAGKGGMDDAMLTNIKTLFKKYTFKEWDRDGSAKKEYVVIAYKTSRYSLLDFGSFFISPTPGTASNGWDNQGNGKHKRCIGWVKLQDKTTKEVFLFCLRPHQRRLDP